MEKPIGDFILENTDGSFMTTNDGRYYHYADVCLLLRKYHQAKLKNHGDIGDVRECSHENCTPYYGKEGEMMGKTCDDCGEEL